MSELELSNEVIGAGQFGEVTKAVLYGTDVCLKRMILSDDVDEDNKYIERELKVLQSIHHPNIMQFMGVCKQKEHTYLVTEYVDGGNLRELLKSDKALPWPTRVRMAADAATAMAYLHQKHIVHRDLKSNNLLVDKQMRIKVCDFGFARTVTTNNKTKARSRAMTLCGTDEWMAPEVILGLPYNEKADVFSFGICLVEIMTRKRPDENMKKRTAPLKYQVFPDEIKNISPKDCPPELIQMVQECTSQDPDDRPDMKEVARRLRMLMKQLLDEEDLKKAAADLEKKKAKSITKVELHINNVQISSVAVFAIEDQPIDILTGVIEQPLLYCETCDETTQGKTVTNAAVRCIDCNIYMCKDHSTSHRQDFAKHAQIPLSLAFTSAAAPAGGGGGGGAVYVSPSYSQGIPNTNSSGNLSVSTTGANTPLLEYSNVTEQDIHKLALKVSKPTTAGREQNANYRFCTTCKTSVPVALLGTSTAHEGHVFEDLLAVVAGMSDKLTTELVMLKEEIKAISQLHHVAEEIIKVSNVAANGTADSIKKQFEEMRRLLDVQETRLLDKVEEERRKKEDEFAKYTTELSSKYTAARTTFNFTGRLLDLCPLSDVGSLVHTVSDRVQGIMGEAKALRAALPFKADDVVGEKNKNRPNYTHVDASDVKEFQNFVATIGTQVARDVVITVDDVDGGGGGGGGGGSRSSRARNPDSNSFYRREIKFQDIVFKKKIGIGQYGEVWAANYLGTAVAVKKLKVSNFNDPTLEEFMKEIDFATSLRHPNIVLFMGACTKAPNFLMVMEKLEYTLYQLLHSQDVPEVHILAKLEMLIDTARGMSFLHAHSPSIIHRDLKSQNLLLDASWTVKIADFGLARMKSENFKMTSTGSPIIMAPEVISGSGNYTEKADVYGMGIIVFEVMTRLDPYPASLCLSPYKLLQQVVHQNLRPKVPDHLENEIPDEVKTLMQRCWAAVPEERPPFSEILEKLQLIHDVVQEAIDQIDDSADPVEDAKQ